MTRRGGGGGGRLLAHRAGPLTARPAGLLEEGRATGELAAGLDPVATATALVAVLQGGYVLARAAESAEVYALAVDGALGLLAGRPADPRAADRARR